MERYILSLDYGTQSVRGMVFDPQGHLLWKKRAAMPHYDRPLPDRAEIDPQEYKKLTIWLCRVMREEAPDLFRRIEGICLACMRDCLTVVDAEGNALRPLILWLDQRRTDTVRPGKSASSGRRGIGRRGHTDPGGKPGGIYQLPSGPGTPDLGKG